MYSLIEDRMIDHSCEDIPDMLKKYREVNKSHLLKKDPSFERYEIQLNSLCKCKEK